jgi:hypothetical protein
LIIRARQRGLKHLSSDKGPKSDVQNGHHADHVTRTDCRNHIRSSALQRRVAATQIVAPQPFTFVNGEAYVLDWLASGESLTCPKFCPSAARPDIEDFPDQGLGHSPRVIEELHRPTWAYTPPCHRHRACPNAQPRRAARWAVDEPESRFQELCGEGPRCPYSSSPVERVAAIQLQQADFRGAMRAKLGQALRERRRRQVGVAGDDEPVAEARLGDPVGEPLARPVADLGLPLEFDPEPEAVRFGAAVGRPES